jgi:hypothetical protein
MGKLLATIGQAIFEAQQSIKAYELSSYWRYFSAMTPDGDSAPVRLTGSGQPSMPDEATPDGSQPLMPKLQRIRIPYPDGNGAQNELNVPLLSLVHHSVLTLDEVKVRMKVSAFADEDSGALHVDVAPARHAPAGTSGQEHVGTVPAPNEHEIELVFRRDAPSEGVARITQEITKLL